VALVIGAPIDVTSTEAAALETARTHLEATLAGLEARALAMLSHPS
jgi:hypothetical protein